MNICSTNYAKLDFKPFVSESVSQFIELLKNKEVQAFLKLFIDNSIAVSELQILQRLRTLENRAGETRTEDKQVIEQTPIPITKTELRACKIVERLKGKRFLSSKEIIHYLKNGIDESLRVKEGSNVRQIKKEVLEKVVELFPTLQLDKKKKGRREVRLIDPT